MSNEDKIVGVSGNVPTAEFFGHHEGENVETTDAKTIAWDTKLPGCALKLIAHTLVDQFLLLRCT